MTEATNPMRDTDDRDPEEVRPEGDEGGSDAPVGTDAPDSIEALRAELEEAQAQYARARADYANLERRSQEQRFEVGRTALADAVRGFLPVLDDLQRALEAAEADAGDAAWVEGLRLVAHKFQGVLESHGVEEIHALGQAFDPTKHEAVGAAPGPENQVVHLLQRGYTLRDRVVRPAMVMVGNGEDAAG
jgi:molecular chaperone GrpE